MSLLKMEFDQAALIAAFQDTLVILAFLQISANIPTLLIRGGGIGDAQVTKHKDARRQG
ncbi:MAG: hypothetical protein HYZ81_16480 [Nitrospinae bacterium]|nr:hypothetical protein [Nitrospinota bacterium]